MDFGGATAGQAGQLAGTSVADVGDLLGNTYEDFAIGAPGNGSAGTQSAVYVVFGSATGTAATIQNWIQVNPSTGNFLYGANDRVVNTGQLGPPTPVTQTNPIISPSTPLTFPFSGITFVTTENPNSGLGTSVAGVQLASGKSALIIGAPNATATGSTTPDGEVFVVTGSFTTYMNQTVDLDNPSAFPGLSIVAYVGSTNGGQLGQSVAGGSNILGDSNGDIIMGAPFATIGAATATPPTPAQTGVVYILSTALLPSGSPTPIAVNTLGQSGTQSVILAGIASGDQTGFSVADAGNVNGAAGKVDDLLIGAPGAAGNAGVAYLVYGSNSLTNLSTTVTLSTGATIRYLFLSNITSTSTATKVPGAIISGPTSSTSAPEFGFSVASAGDFNSDGFGDFMIGAPFYSSSSTVTDQGLVALLYGAPSTSSSFITGTLSLANLPSGINPLFLYGADAAVDERPGSSESLMSGVINSGQPNEILIGAPGFTYQGVAGAGTAYLIPGTDRAYGDRCRPSTAQPPCRQRRPVRALLAQRAGGQSADPLRGIGRWQAANDDQHGRYG